MGVRGRTRPPLAVINPGLILGPLMGNDFGSSVGLIWKLMTGKFTRLPRYGCSVVDVRDVAQAHVQAMIQKYVANATVASGSFISAPQVKMRSFGWSSNQSDTNPVSQSKQQ
jgi:hypothetical protein